MQKQGGGISIVTLLWSVLFAWLGYNHPFWGMGRVPAAIVAIPLGSVVVFCVVAVIVGVCSLVVALCTR